VILVPQRKCKEEGSLFLRLTGDLGDRWERRLLGGRIGGRLRQVTRSMRFRGFGAHGSVRNLITTL
jgi:hypothetical protein